MRREHGRAVSKYTVRSAQRRRRKMTEIMTSVISRGSSVVEQWSEEPCVASSILALGTKRSPLVGDFLLSSLRHMPIIPTLKLEEMLRQDGVRYIVGVDEVGRGPLAGPVTAAAVVFDLGLWSQLASFSAEGQVRDSKVMKAEKRAAMIDRIRREALIVGVDSVEPAEIDEINILQATFKAMKRAIGQVLEVIDPALTRVVVDGNQLLPNFALKQMAVVGGDAEVFSVACASVIAKVHRDALMDRLHDEFPVYGWQKNKGYGTAEHIKALKEHGLTAQHRRSFIHFV